NGAWWFRFWAALRRGPFLLCGRRPRRGDVDVWSWLTPPAQACAGSRSARQCAIRHSEGQELSFWGSGDLVRTVAKVWYVRYQARHMRPWGAEVAQGEGVLRCGVSFVVLGQGRR